MQSYDKQILITLVIKSPTYSMCIENGNRGYFKSAVHEGLLYVHALPGSTVTNITRLMPYKIFTHINSLVLTKILSLQL